MALRRLLTAQKALGAALCAVIAAVAASSCLADLEAPTTCPTPAKQKTGDCAAGIGDAKLGCLRPEQVSCLTGPRDGCACGADECPARADACYPKGDCPPEVTAAAGAAEVTCHTLAPDDIGGGLTSEDQCLCGCAACAAVCDGKGPVFGIIKNASFKNFDLPIIDIEKYMPDSGKLGVYLRLRGLTNAFLSVLKKDGDQYLELQSYYLVTPIETDFVEQVFFNQEFLGQEAYSWERAEDKPTALALVPYGDSKQAVVTLFEIDCAVPFVVPRD